MRVGLLGTGFGLAHAAVYQGHPEVESVVVFGRTRSKLDRVATEFGFGTTTDIDSIYHDPSVDLIDVCLPTPLHVDHVIRALDCGKHALCELPLATTVADAQRVVDAHATSDRQVFVDMAGRFDPATEILSEAIDSGCYGSLRSLQFGTRTALLWEGYDLGLESIAMDMLHGTLDIVASALGQPPSVTARSVTTAGEGSAAEVLLAYPATLVACSASALMPKPYGLRGGYLATFESAVLESLWTAGWDGRPTGKLTEYSDTGAHELDLRESNAYAAVIDHVFDCLAGKGSSRLTPASVIDSLQLTLDVRDALTAGLSDSVCNRA
jgi:predicted dehydrogenase